MKPRKLDDAALWEYALRALATRALSTGEMRTRLSQRATEESSVEPILLRLKEAGYLDDARFAESYASARLETQGHGRQRVLRDLRQRRVAAPVAGKAVAGTYEGTDEVELVEQYLARKFRNKKLPEYLSEPANLASAYRKLRYAGFSGGVSIRVLKRYSEMADQLEGEEEVLENESRQPE